MNAHRVASLSELRRLYEPLPEQSLARRIIFGKLHRHHRAFIALSPFVVIASANRDGAPEVSPRGDLPGFAAVLDDCTIVLPDRPGNKKLMTLTNFLENLAVSLIFFVPGRTNRCGSAAARGSPQTRRCWRRWRRTSCRKPPWSSRSNARGCIAGVR